MELQQLPKKIVKKLLRYAYRSCGIDHTSRASISGRNDLKEIGTKYGGWVVPTSLLNAGSVCYLAGCGEDISFDIGLIDEFQCHVYGFDPTPRSIEYVESVAGDNPKYHFFDVGLWNEKDVLKFFVPKNPQHVSHSLLNLQKTEESIAVKVERLSSLMERLGHRKLDLLKIDIEGAEYKVIESIIEDDVDIKVVCVEYDECFNPLDAKYRDRIQESVNSLLEYGYSLVCAQGDGNYTFVKNG
jgi:FkbM family methyltransferase